MSDDLVQRLLARKRLHRVTNGLFTLTTDEPDPDCLEAADALTAQDEEIERLREALKSAEHFADWALRHTWPERAKRNGPDAVYSILANHPFAKTLGGKP